MIRLCTHKQTTLVQHVDDNVGWFACYQCDNCGQITRQEVTAADLDTANDAPLLDEGMYLDINQRINARLTDMPQHAALRFFGKALR